MSIPERIQEVSKSITEACLAAGRNPEDVALMLVTKTVPASKIVETFKAGHRLFGENKIQETIDKWNDPGLESFKPDFIGHLQTNKVKACLNHCGRIQSIDRLRLAEALDRELSTRHEVREVFLQVNTSAEPSKFGVPVAEALEFARSVKNYPRLKVTGLMTLALFSDDQNQVRACFQRLKKLFDEIKNENLFDDDFKHLSMGMSSDYQIAIAEGATIIRVGTAIFGARSTPDSYYWPETPKTS